MNTASVSILILFIGFVIPLQSSSLHDLNNSHTRYYYNPPCENQEPPSSNPHIYDYGSNVIPAKPAPNWQNPLPGTDANCTHPPVPPLLVNNYSFRKYRDDSFYLSEFRLRKLGLGKYVDQMRNCAVGDPYFNSIRNSDSENPGYYFQYPWGSINIDSSALITLEERIYIEKLSSDFISTDYHTETLGDSLENVYIDDLERREFFFEAQLNDTVFRFSGWYGKFGHIFVLTDYDSVAGFIAMAQKYFKMPQLDESKVSYSEDIEKYTGYRDFFYSYDDPEAGFNLFGYPYTKTKREGNNLIYYHDHVILDLTIYTGEE